MFFIKTQIIIIFFFFSSSLENSYACDPLGPYISSIKAHLTSYVNNSFKLSSYDNYREPINHEKPQALPYDPRR